MKEFTIDKNDENRRLDSFLRSILRESNDGFIYKMLRKKNITLNDKPAKGNTRLKKFDIIKIYFSDETFEKLSGDIKEVYDKIKELDYSNIDICYEDDEIVCVNKKCGQLSQKSKDADISINEQIISYLINTRNLSRENLLEFKPSVINRLDRNTTGIIILAKQRGAFNRITNNIKNNEIDKFYKCIVTGDCKLDGEYSAYYKKDEINNIAYIYDTIEDNAKTIRTGFNKISYANGVSLLNVKLFTGKSHQIRAHLAHLGYPIIGDKKYNGDCSVFKHQLLHAYKVVIPGKPVIEAPLPKEFERILDGNMEL